MVASKINRFVAELVRNPGRLRDLLGTKLAYKLRWQKVPFLPIKIDIEPINTCNFKCSHCQVTYWDKKPAHFNRETFIRVIKQIPNLMNVKLQGMGEPFLNKQLIPMLQAGEERGIQMSLYTNGSISDPVKAEQLSQLNRTHITFSIDGATAETFEKMRPGSHFDRIVENIQMLTGARNPNSKLLVSAWTVITQKNIHELPQIVALVKRLGFDDITIQPHLTSWGKEEMIAHTDDIQVTMESDLFVTQLDQAQQLATAEGIELKINASNRFCRDQPCGWPWNSSYIAVNGDVVPCCVIADANVAKMGNVFEQDFSEIWNSEAYQELRDRITKHDLPDYCKHCYVDP
jgi:radical SAM protein with 4Fe4S-binding SPASM domain